MKLYQLRSKRTAWRRSTFCATAECAELTREDGMILVRNSLMPRVVVRYTPEEFRALRLAFQAGEFDDLA